MKREITVAEELEGGTTTVLGRWPRWVEVVAAAVVLAAGVVAPAVLAVPAVPAASGVVNGLAPNGLGAGVAAVPRAPPRASDPFLWIASVVIPIPAPGLGEDTTGIVGELGVVGSGGAVIGVVTTGGVGMGVGVGVGVDVGVAMGVEAGLCG
jgi:hypothetical protein